MTRTPRPIEIETREWLHPPEYAIVGKKRGKLVWFCGIRRRSAYNKPIWSYGDGWAHVAHKLPAIKKALKIAQEDDETIASNIKQISIVKLTTRSSQTAEVIPNE
jgi:hypothetical protein